MNYIKYVLVVLFNLILVFFSVYAVWGWLCLMEIKELSIAKGIDYDAVLNDIVRSHSPELSYSSKNGTSVRYEGSAPFVYPEFKKYSVSIYNANINHENGAPQISVFEYSLLYPFTALPKEFLNFIICMSIGYLLSISFLLSRLLRNIKMDIAYIFLKPISSTLLSGVLFLLVLSGCKIILDSHSSFSSPGIGIISLLGVVWSENIDIVVIKNKLTEFTM